MHLLLFYPGVGFGADYWTPLHFACLRGSQRTVGLLVGVGASIEEKTTCFFYKEMMVFIQFTWPVSLKRSLLLLFF